MNSPYTYFYSWEQTNLHQQASKVYRNPEYFTSSDNNEKICPCCGLVAFEESNKIPLTCSYIEFSHLGPCYPLYFQFIQFCIIILSIVYTIYSIDKESPVISFFICIILLAAITVYRQKQMYSEFNIDKGDISVSDFTVQLSNYPKQKTVQEIKLFFETLISKENCIQKVIIGYDMKEYNKLTQQLKDNSSDKFKTIELLTEFATKGELRSSGVCFVSFSNEYDVVNTLNLFSYDKNNFTIQQFVGGQQKSICSYFEQMKVNQAPEPGDIQWENLQKSFFDKSIRRLLTYIVIYIIIMIQIQKFQKAVSIILTLCFFVILQIVNLKKEKDYQNILNSILLSVTVVLINFILTFSIQKFAQFNSYNSKTEFYINTTKLLGLSQFINTSIIPFIANPNITSLKNNMTSIMISNAFLPFLFEAANLPNIIRNIKIYLFKKKQPAEQRKYTQNDVNLLFEYPKFNISQLYASQLKTYLLALFYSYLIPEGILICTIGLFLNYWIHKYNIINRQSIPHPIGTQISQFVTNFYIKSSVLVYLSGYLIFKYEGKFTDVEQLSILGTFLAILYIFVPVDKILKRIFRIETQYIEQINYNQGQQEGFFQNDYDRFNPILKQQAIEQYQNMRGSLKQEMETYAFQKQN